VTKSFIPKLAFVMKAKMKHSATIDNSSSIKVVGGSFSDFVHPERADDPESESKKYRKKKQKDDQEYDNKIFNVNDEDGVAGSRFGHRKEMTSYGDMDDDEKKLSKEPADKFFDDSDSSDAELAVMSEEERDSSFDSKSAI
jgi:hypothetical protein